VAITDDVTRLFHRLVEVLASRGQLQESITFPDLYEKIMPYRSNRTSLRFDTNQDYEMALLRLLAGEQELVEVDPPEVATILAQEVRGVNPDPGAFKRFAGARARLSYKAVREIIDAHDAYAPPGAPEVKRTPAPVSMPSRQLPFDLEDPGLSPVPSRPDSCPQCSRGLPAGRAIKFCPHCGGNVKVRDCPQCGTQLELDWRHCVSCGYRVT
jgi:hypothetical protein